MAEFNIEEFQDSLAAGGNNLFEATGDAFGVPSCLMNLAKDVASALPSKILGGVLSNVKGGKEKANDFTKGVVNALSLNTGIFEFDTDTGFLTFKSDSSWIGLNEEGNSYQNDLNSFLGAAEYAAQFGSQLYSNYESVKAQIDAVIGCLKKFNESEKAKTTDAGSDSDTAFKAAQKNLEGAREFILAATETEKNINLVLAERFDDPSLEPILSDSVEFDPFLDGASFNRAFPKDPGLYGDKTFRLIYGPPLSNKGQYLLTSDGLYYDSQKGGIDPINLAISGVVPQGDAWKYNFPPNLGGKGDSISLKDLSKFTDTIFDPNFIDDSVSLTKYYEADTMLQMLIQQRAKQIHDMSGILEDYQTSYGDESSITRNYRESLISTSLVRNETVNRRKKQIEVLVKVPMLYGDGSVEYTPGNIPVNNFDVLEKYNVAVAKAKQEKLVFRQAEVSGIVLPIETKYVTVAQKDAGVDYTSLVIPKVGIDSIITEGSSTAPVVSLTDGIETGSIVAIYNFLETNTVTPSSVSFGVLNSAGSNKSNNAQLNSTDPAKVFTKGLGIPYLDGIVRNKSSLPASTSAMGNFYKLPDTQDFRDLFYSKKGFTVEFWAYASGITDYTSWDGADASSLTRAILSCENVGVKSGVSALDNYGDIRDLDYLGLDEGDSYVKGFVLGFTRDRRIVKDSSYSNLNTDNNTIRFFFGPTQSRDASSASWINNSDCLEDTTYYGLKVNPATTSTNGKSLGAINSEFVLVTVVGDPSKNKLAVYADGEVVSETTLTGAFGSREKQSINLPTLKKDNSFQYSSSSVDGPTTLHGGPKLNSFYTPFIVGGGYTDGMSYNGNFLGGDRGGVTSAFKGHIGSLRFYRKPLSDTNIMANYNSQRGFFKNIRVDDSLVMTPLVQDGYYGPPNENATTAHYFDYYPAKTKFADGNPTLLYFHPGGGTGGSKELIEAGQIKAYVDHDINVLSFNYRLGNTTGELSDADTYPNRYPMFTAGRGFGSEFDSSSALLPKNDGIGPLVLSGVEGVNNFKNAIQDVIRAIQFTKYNSATYNVDKDKIIISGSSFGGAVGLMVAMGPDYLGTSATTNDPVQLESTIVHSVLVENAAWDLAHSTNFDSSRYPAAKGQAYSVGKTVYNMSGTQWVASSVAPLDSEVMLGTSSNTYPLETSSFKSSYLNQLNPHTKYTLGFLYKNSSGNGLGVPAGAYENYDTSSTFHYWGTIPSLKARHEIQNTEEKSRYFWSPENHMVSAGDFGPADLGLDHLRFGKLENSGIPVCVFGMGQSLSGANIHDQDDWIITLPIATITTLSSTTLVDFFTVLPTTSSLENYYDDNGLGAIKATVAADATVSALLSVSGFGWPSPVAGTANRWSVSAIHENHGGTAFKIADPARNIDLSTTSYIVDSSSLGYNGSTSATWYSVDEHDIIYGIKTVEGLKAKYAAAPAHQLYSSAIHTGSGIYYYPGYLEETNNYSTSAIGTNGETVKELLYNERVNWLVNLLASSDTRFDKYVGAIELLPDAEKGIY